MPNRMSHCLTRTDPIAREKLLVRIGLPLLLRAGFRLLRESDRWAYLGDSLVRQNRPEDALEAFAQALAMEPDNSAFLDATIALLAGLKRPQAALELLEQKPPSADTCAAQATLFLDLGDLKASLFACDQALEFKTNHFSARLNRGAALRGLKRIGDALENDRLLVEMYPDNPGALYNLGDALMATGCFEEARQRLVQSVQNDPDYVPARMALGLALSMLKRFAEAEDAFATARRQDPRAANLYVERAAHAMGLADATELPANPLAIFLSLTAKAQQVCDWRERTNLESLLKKTFGKTGAPVQVEKSLAFNVLLLDLPHDVQRGIARQVAHQANEAAARWPHRADIGHRHSESLRSGRRKLRIGYLSPDFRPHPVVECHWRQLQLHDRSRFEVSAYSLLDLGPCEPRRRIEDASDHFIELSQLPSEDIVQRIAQDGIDILVDLSGYTDHTRPEILAARPAPIQVQYLGSPGPTSGGLIDYRIADRVITPVEESALWDESLVWLPETFMICDDTLTIGTTPTRRDCGLPDDGFVFCCFNTHHKMDPASFGIWMRLMEYLPNSVLWLAEGTRESRANLGREAELRGINAKRLIFAPRIAMPDHLARHVCADLFLDTPYYSANVTAFNALRAGLPMLTCYGRTMASRMGASVVEAAGIPELVAYTLADYEDRALYLATHSTDLAEIREKLIKGIVTAPLFQTERRVRHIERAYEQMWARHAAGQPPESFELMA